MRWKRKWRLACALGGVSAIVEDWEHGERMVHASHIHQPQNMPKCKGTAAHPELFPGAVLPSTAPCSSHWLGQVSTLS